MFYYIVFFLKKEAHSFFKNAWHFYFPEKLDQQHLLLDFHELAMLGAFAINLFTVAFFARRSATSNGAFLKILRTDPSVSPSDIS